MQSFVLLCFMFCVIDFLFDFFYGVRADGSLYENLRYRLRTSHSRVLSKARWESGHPSLDISYNIVVCGGRNTQVITLYFTGNFGRSCFLTVS